MKIIKKIRELHNKLIQKLDRPFFINMLICIFPWVAMFVPGSFGIIVASSIQVIPEDKGISYILGMFTLFAVLSFVVFQKTTNVEKYMKDCVHILIFDAIISYGTFFVVFFYHLLFH